jgi:hypothetical protein
VEFCGLQTVPGQPCEQHHFRNLVYNIICGNAGSVDACDIDHVTLFVRPFQWLDETFAQDTVVNLTSVPHIQNYEPPEGYALLADKPYVMAVPVEFKLAVVLHLNDNGVATIPHKLETTVCQSNRSVSAGALSTALKNALVPRMWVQLYGMKMPVANVKNLLKNTIPEERIIVDIGMRFRFPDQVVLFAHRANSNHAVFPMFNLTGLGSVDLDVSELLSLELDDELQPHRARFSVEKGTLYPEMVHFVKLSHISQPGQLLTGNHQGRTFRTRGNESWPNLLETLQFANTHHLLGGFRAEFRFRLADGTLFQPIINHMTSIVMHIPGVKAICVPAEAVITYIRKTLRLAHKRLVFVNIANAAKLSDRQKVAWAFISNAFGLSSKDINKWRKKLDEPGNINDLYPAVDDEEPLEPEPLNAGAVAGLVAQLQHHQNLHGGLANGNPLMIVNQPLTAEEEKACLMRYMYVRRAPYPPGAVCAALAANGQTFGTRQQDTVEGKRALVNEVFATFGASWRAHIKRKPLNEPVGAPRPLCYHMNLYMHADADEQIEALHPGHNEIVDLDANGENGDDI